MPDNSNGLMGLDPDLLLNIGSGLLSIGGRNLAGQGNPGQVMQQSMTNYYAQKQNKQVLQKGNLEIQQMQQEMPMRLDWLKGMGEFFHSANNDPKLAQRVQGLMGDPSAQIPQTDFSAPPQSGPQGVNPQPRGGPIQTLPDVTMPTPQGAPMGPSPIGGGTPQGGGGGAPQGSPQPPTQGQLGGGSLGGDPMQLLRMAAGGEALGFKTGALQDLAKTQLQYNPQIATQMEAAKSKVAVLQSQISEALQHGNTPLAMALSQSMRQELGLLHIASMSGTQTRIGLDGNISTFSPNEGIQTANGVASVIPGAAEARGTLAGAEARGKATGETVEVTGPDGEKYLVPKSTITGGGGGAGRAPLPKLGAPRPGAPATPGAAPPGASGTPLGFPASLPPAKEAMLKGNAEAALESNKAYQEQAENGQQMVAQTQSILNAAKDFTPGRFADSKATVLDYLNSTGLINWVTQDGKKALGSYQEGSKISIQLQAMATKALGSKEAQQVFTTMGKSVPNLTLSADGLQKIGAWQMGIARYQMARAQDANEKAQANDAKGVNQVRDTWAKNSNALYYVVASAPPAVREEFLSSMKDRTSFVNGWRAAAKAGYAPRPTQYDGVP